MVQNRRSLYDGSAGGTETMASNYDFTGKVKQVKQAQSFGTATTTVDKFYTYDQAGRLTTTKQQIAGDTQNGLVTLAENSYNEIGQLIDKKLHKTTSGTYLQSVDYTYNIRGWLTGINNPDNLSALQAGDTNLDLYGQRLQYDVWETNLTTSAQVQYNGNISAMVWNTSGKSKQGYRFAYDGLNRLNESDHKDYGSYWADNNKYEEKSITYDLNGNIKNLVRTDAAGGTMASYTYTYSGNQLASVGIGTAYVYDKNGNATTDGMRGMQVTYNLLNLPKTVSKGSDNIAYIYSATGEKLAKKKKDNTYQYYAGSMVYNNDKLLDYLIFEEGLVYKTSTLYAYEYHLKDHLGNVRVTFQPNGNGTTVKQATEYYPFGMNYPQSPGGTNKYLYNGKEKQDDQLSGTYLDWYDYGARMYDPVIGRWHSVDPLAEKRSNESPFAYCGNNPVSRIDPTGMMWDDELAAKDLKKKAFEKIISLTNGIGLRNKEMADKNTSEARKDCLNEEITGMMDRINELGNSINQIDQLGDDQDNTYVLNDGTTKDSPLVGDVTNPDKGIVSINAPTDGLAFHEIRHISQSLNSGGLKFNNGKLQNAGTDDHTKGNMEIEAYQSQFSFTGKKIAGKIIYSPKAITYELIGSYRDKKGNLLYPFMNSSK